MNEGETKQPGQAGMDPAAQSAADRQKNFEQAAAEVSQKMATNPEKVTPEEGNMLHSREQRAFGQTEKGGVASHAQSLASENEKKGTI